MARLSERPITGPALRAAAAALRLPLVGRPLSGAAAQSLELHHLRSARVPVDAVPWSPSVITAAADPATADRPGGDR